MHNICSCKRRLYQLTFMGIELEDLGIDVAEKETINYINADAAHCSTLFF